MIWMNMTLILIHPLPMYLESDLNKARQESEELKTRLEVNTRRTEGNDNGSRRKNYEVIWPDDSEYEIMWLPCWGT